MRDSLVQSKTRGSEQKCEVSKLHFILIDERHKDHVVKNTDLDITVLQKYICVIQMRVVVHLLQVKVRLKVHVNNTKTIPLEENANLLSDTFG